jgi:hypothetical protein
MTGEQLQLWDVKHDCDAARVVTQPVYTTVIHQLPGRAWGFRIVEVCRVFLYLVCRSMSGFATCEGHVVVTEQLEAPFEFRSSLVWSLFIMM